MTLSKQIDSLRSLGLPALQKEYERVTGSKTNSGDKEGMIQRISERLLHGGKAPAAAPATDAKPSAKARPAPAKEGSPFLADPRLPAVGQKIEKEIRGKKRTVTVRADGLEFEGRTYRSLSKIACEILGCSANGYLTFGLTGRPAAKPATEKAPAAKAKAAPKARKGTRAKARKS